MATAADHKIIIEKGADFQIDLRVTLDGVNPKPLVNVDTTGATTVTYGVAANAAAVLAEVGGYGANGDMYVVKDDAVNTTTYVKTYTSNGVDTWTDNGLTKITTYTASFTLLYNDAGSVAEQAVTETVTITNALNGEFTVLIDENATTGTGSLSPLPPGQISELLAQNPFATEYNYFYHIDLYDATGTATDNNIRVLRGKAAVRV